MPPGLVASAVRAVRDDRAQVGRARPDPWDPGRAEAGLVPALQITGRSPVGHQLDGPTSVSDAEVKHARRMTRVANSGSSKARTRGEVAREVLNGLAAKPGRPRGARARRGSRAPKAAAGHPVGKVGRGPRSRATEIGPGPRSRANYGRTRHGALLPRLDRSVPRPPPTSRSGNTRRTVTARIGDRPTGRTGCLRSAATAVRSQVPRLRTRSSSPQERSWSPVAVRSRRRSRLGGLRSACW